MKVYRFITCGFVNPSDELKECPPCQCPCGYTNGEDQYACPECSFEWKPSEEEISDALNVVDSNGNPL